MLNAGDRFGDYTVVRRLGKGGNNQRTRKTIAANLKKLELVK